jgi:hypothetical protein
MQLATASHANRKLRITKDDDPQPDLVTLAGKATLAPEALSVTVNALLFSLVAPSRRYRWLWPLVQVQIS